MSEITINSTTGEQIGVFESQPIVEDLKELLKDSVSEAALSESERQELSRLRETVEDQRGEIAELQNQVARLESRDQTDEAWRGYVSS